MKSIITILVSITAVHIMAGDLPQEPEVPPPSKGNVTATVPKFTPSETVGRYIVINFTNDLSGSGPERGLLRLDTATGRTWLYQDSTVNGNLVAVWIPIDESAYSTAALASMTNTPSETPQHLRH